MRKVADKSQETARPATQTPEGMPEVVRAENLTLDAINKIKASTKEPDPIVVYAKEKEYAELLGLLGTTGDRIRLYGSDTSLRLFGIEIRKADLSAKITGVEK